MSQKASLQLPLRKHQRQLSATDMVFDESPRDTSVASLDLAESLPRTPRSRPVDREIPALEVTYVDAEAAPKPAEVKMTIYKSEESPRDQRGQQHKHKKDKTKGGKEKERQESANAKTDSKAAPIAHNKPDEMKGKQEPEKQGSASPAAKHLAVPLKPVLVPMASSGSLLSFDKNRRLTLKAALLTALQEGNIGVICDDYNDIFSDFDPRPYTSRILSKDFMDECRRQYHGGDSLRILVPEKQRSRRVESVIKERIGHFFRGQRRKARKKFWRLVVIALLLIAVGLLLSVLRVYLKWSEKKGLGWLTLNAFLDPGAAFMIWTGLERILFDIWGLSSKAKRAKKLAKVTIIFVGYGKQYEKTKDSLEPPVVAEAPPCDPP